MNRVLLFIGGIMLLSSCAREDSSSVDQDKIWTSYEMFYNANEDKTYARATFKFSNATGTHLELVNDSEVIVNDEPMTWKPLLAYYEKEFAGLVSSGEFSYTDLDGSNFINTVEIINSIAFPAIDSVSRDAAYELNWDGADLEIGESVLVTINGINEGDAQIFSQANVGAGSIILDKDKLEKLPAGSADVWMDRSLISTPQAATSAGGLMNGRYRAENTSIIFK